MPETSNWNISIKTWRWDNKSTETSLDEKKSNIWKKQLPYWPDFIDNYFIVISCYFH